MHRCYCASSHNWISNSNRFHVVRQICEVDSLHQKLHPCGLLHTLGCVPQHVCPGLHNNREIYTALQQYLTWKLDKSVCSLPITHFSTIVVLEDANSATRWTSAVITDKWVRSFGVSKNQPLNSWELSSFRTNKDKNLLRPDFYHIYHLFRVKKERKCTFKL